jgi:hypothetical protein
VDGAPLSLVLRLGISGTSLVVEPYLRRLVVRSDLALLEQLYRQHRRELVRLVDRELHDVHEAEDVVQVTFLKARQAIERGAVPRSACAGRSVRAPAKVRSRARPLGTGIGDGGATHARAEALLLAWFRAKGRDLPWRRTRDPCAILVSEVMAQQNPVENVLI